MQCRVKFSFDLEIIYLTAIALFFMVILGEYQQKNDIILQSNLSL